MTLYRLVNLRGKLYLLRVIEHQPLSRKRARARWPWFEKMSDLT